MLADVCRWWLFEMSSHPDFRLSRRALIISRLAQTISERKVQGGLRRVLLTQAKRLQWLAARRYKALGGPASVQVEARRRIDGGELWSKRLAFSTLVR